MTLRANNTAGETLYYTHGGQKNVTALFGQAVERREQYENDPYGNPINTTGDAAALNPYRYSSEYHDEDLGLIYYNYRHYNPQDGRWINRDPIHEEGGVNLYAFVGNSPCMKGDVLGLDVADNTNRNDPFFSFVNDEFVNDALDSFSLLPQRDPYDYIWFPDYVIKPADMYAIAAIAECNLPKYEKDKTNREYDKYDIYFIKSVFFWAPVFGMEHFNSECSKECLCKIARLLKSMAWTESSLGYESGFVDKKRKYPLQEGSKRRWIDTEDVMQSAFSKDMTIHSKIYQEAMKYSPFKTFMNSYCINGKSIQIPNDYSNLNISGEQSIFYGTMWFFYKMREVQKGNLRNECLKCDDETLKNAVKNYNGGGDNKYVDKVWKVFQSNVMRDIK